MNNQNFIMKTDMKKIIFTLVSVLTTALNAGAQTTIFNSGNGTTPYYRIPAILNQNDTLWAFTDDRSEISNTSCWGDIGCGKISIIAKTSTDNGATWSSSTKTVAAGSSNSSGFAKAHGDAAVICDREDPNKMLVMCASGETSYGKSIVYYSGYYTYAIKVGKYLSEDGGSTWTGTDVTSSIYGIWNSSSVVITKLFFSSGRICQSSIIKNGNYYRLYAALCTNVGSLVVYSDDFGDTWSALGGTSARPVSSGDEAKIEELPNGNVLISSRMTGGRYFNVFTYKDQSSASGSWGYEATSNSSSTNGIIAQYNSTNGEILILPALENGDVSKPVYIALQSVPYGNTEHSTETNNTYKRSNVSIYWKVLSSKTDLDEPSDFTSGWTRYEVSNTTSAYSSMTLDKDNNIAFIYEENAINTTIGGSGNMDYYDIQFKSLSLKDITLVSSSSAKQTRATTETYYTVSTLSAEEHWSAFSGESSGSGSGSTDTGDDSGETTDTKSIDYWLGKVFTLKSLLTYPSTSSNYGTTVQRYIHSTYDSDGKLKLEAKKVEEVSSFDYTYYWTLSKDPDGEYYYLSCLNGDSYMGQEAGVSKEGDIVSYGNATCTDNYKTEFQVLDFVTSWGFDSDHVLAAKTLSSGVAFKFYVQYSGESKELRVLSLNENGKFGWTKHTQTGELDGSPQTYFSTEFILTEVTAGNINEYGTIESPTHYGFPVKMTRSDDGKADVDIEGYYYYGTLKLPFAVDLTSAVDAAGNKYDLSVFNCTGPTNVDGKKVGLTEITTLTDNTLPRETPVLLRMGRKDKADYPATQITLYLQPALAQNIEETGFKGTLGKKSFTNDEYNPTTNANFFILGKKATDGRVKFYYLNDQVLAANKAYYVYDGSTSAKTLTFSFQDSPSAIGMPEADDEDDMTAPVFDLAGRRITGKASKGVYIRNGKKFVVR